MITAEERRRHAVSHDRWDSVDYQATHDQVPALAEMVDRLQDVHWAAAPLVEDVFHVFHQGFPRLADVDPQFKANRAVVGELIDMDDVRKLREYTVNDRYSSALAVGTMEKHVASVYERVHGEIADRAAEAQRRLDAYRDAVQRAEETAEAGAETDPGPTGQGPGSDLEALAAAADEALDALDEAIDGQTPAISAAMRAGAAEAADEAEENAENMARWGYSKGDVAHLDPEERIKLAAEISSPAVVAIAKLFGAMRSDARGRRDQKWTTTPDEIHDVTLGDDLDHLIEFEGLVIPELEDLFLLDYLAKSLLVYELRGNEKVTQGSIIYIEDGSDSMHWHGGQKHRHAKAFGLALLGIAKDEGRGFHAIVFGGTGQVQVFDFPEPADFTPRKMLDYAAFSFAGAGTCFQTPLDVAVALMNEEHDLLGRVEADIVLATDGDTSVAPAWLEAFHAEQARLRFDVFGLIIGGPPRAPLTDIANRGVERVESLVDGSSVEHVFQALYS